MRIFLIALILSFGSNLALADEVRIPWHGDYPHNSSKHWSKENPYDSGFSKNFKNGTPQEFGDVQKDGELIADIIVPKGTTGPIPFMIVMHGCDGMTNFEKEWTHHVADLLVPEGYGVLILDSYTTRFVDNSCGMPDQHWGRRRADDAYSALDYLLDHELAKPNEVYVMGYSNGGLASLMAMTKKEADHPHHFAAGFPIAPNCYSVITKYGDYYAPMIVFVGLKDDANPAAPCIEMMKKKRATPVQLIEYKDANHGFLGKGYASRVQKGWTDSHGKDHMWHLSYDPAADNDMMATIIAAIKTKTFKKGVEYR